MAVLLHSVATDPFRTKNRQKKAPCIILYFVAFCFNGKFFQHKKTVTFNRMQKRGANLDYQNQSMNKCGDVIKKKQTLLSNLGQTFYIQDKCHTDVSCYVLKALLDT